MDIKDLSKRAMEIRHRYSEYEKQKIGREWNRAEIAQGFAGDVGELMKVVMAKEGVRDMDNVDELLRHELADCLWSVLVLADQYGIDLEKSFMDTMAELDQRLDTIDG